MHEFWRVPCASLFLWLDINGLHCPSFKTGTLLLVQQQTQPSQNSLQRFLSTPHFSCWFTTDQEQVTGVSYDVIITSSMCQYSKSANSEDSESPSPSGMILIVILVFWSNNDACVKMQSPGPPHGNMHQSLLRPDFSRMTVFMLWGHTGKCIRHTCCKTTRNL